MAHGLVFVTAHVRELIDRSARCRLDYRVVTDYYLFLIFIGIYCIFQLKKIMVFMPLTYITARTVKMYIIYSVMPRLLFASLFKRAVIFCNSNYTSHIIYI